MSALVWGANATAWQPGAVRCGVGARRLRRWPSTMDVLSSVWLSSTVPSYLDVVLTNDAAAGLYTIRAVRPVDAAPIPLWRKVRAWLLNEEPT